MARFPRERLVVDERRAPAHALFKEMAVAPARDFPVHSARSGFRLGTALLVGCVAGQASAAEAAVTLLPHHAVYKLTLAASTGSKAPADASGMISYDFSGSACEGYKTTFRQITALQPAEGDTRVSETKTTTLESGDAKTFDFDISTVVNQGDPDAVKGEATRAKGGDLDINLEAPQNAQVDVKTDALFPTEQLSRIITTAEGGGKLLAAPVFDGSDTGRKVYTTLAVIGAPIMAPAPEAAAQVDALRTARRWPVTISYFEQGQNDSQPAYVLSFDLYENGVSRALKVNYGNFTLAGEMVEFKPGAASGCSK